MNHHRRAALAACLLTLLSTAAFAQDAYLRMDTIDIDLDGQGGQGVETFDNCASPFGGTVAHGADFSAFAQATVPYGEVCGDPVQVTCSDGVLSSNASAASCAPALPQGCVASWASNLTVAHGSSLSAFATATVPHDQDCVSELRTCENGSFTGTYDQGACVKLDPPGPPPLAEAPSSFVKSWLASTFTQPEYPEWYPNYIAQIAIAGGADMSGGQVILDGMLRVTAGQSSMDLRRPNPGVGTVRSHVSEYASCVAMLDIAMTHKPADKRVYAGGTKSDGAAVVTPDNPTAAEIESYCATLPTFSGISILNAR